MKRIILILLTVVILGCSLLPGTAPITVENQSSYIASVYCGTEYMDDVLPGTKLSWEGDVGTTYELFASCILGTWGPRKFVLWSDGFTWRLHN